MRRARRVLREADDPIPLQPTSCLSCTNTTRARSGVTRFSGGSQYVVAVSSVLQGRDVPAEAASSEYRGHGHRSLHWCRPPENLVTPAKSAFTRHRLLACPPLA